MPVLKEVSLSISPGEKVALAGNSGSGKSTLIKLIAGLLKTEEGSISIDGNDLNRLNLDSYYRHITYIPQESPVLTALYGKPFFSMHSSGRRTQS